MSEAEVAVMQPVIAIKPALPEHKSQSRQKSLAALRIAHNYVQWIARKYTNEY